MKDLKGKCEPTYHMIQRDGLWTCWVKNGSERVAQAWGKTKKEAEANAALIAAAPELLECCKALLDVIDLNAMATRKYPLTPGEYNDMQGIVNSVVKIVAKAESVS